MEQLEEVSGYFSDQISFHFWVFVLMGLFEERNSAEIPLSFVVNPLTYKERVGQVTSVMSNSLWPHGL